MAALNLELYNNNMHQRVVLHLTSMQSESTSHTHWTSFHSEYMTGIHRFHNDCYVHCLYYLHHFPRYTHLCTSNTKCKEHQYQLSSNLVLCYSYVIRSSCLHIGPWISMYQSWLLFHRLHSWILCSRVEPPSQPKCRIRSKCPLGCHTSWSNCWISTTLYDQ